MAIGLTGKAFGNMLLLCALLSCVTIVSLIYYLRHKKIDIFKKSIGFWIVFGVIFVFVVIPYWLTDLTVKAKIIGTFIIMGIGIGNYFAIDRAQRVLWKAKGIDPSKSLERDKQQIVDDQSPKK